MKTNIRQLWANNPNRIFFLNEGSEHHRNVAFAAIEPKSGKLACSNCGSALLNATNLNNRVHFCINRELDITFGKYEIKV